MRKRGFVIVFFLLFSLLLVASSNSQSDIRGCCVSSSTASSLTCTNNKLESECLGTHRWEADVLCSQLADGACQLGCKICVPQTAGTGTSRYLWGYKATNCTPYAELKFDSFVASSEPRAQNQSACQATGTVSVITNLPNITGTIRDGDAVTATKPPVPGATVACLEGGKSTTTLADGSYRLIECSEGTLTIKATLGSKTGFKVLTSVTRGNQYTANINITSVTARQIRINVTNETNNALISAEVTVSPNASNVPETKTGNSLQFKVGLGYVTVSAQKQSYIPVPGTTGLIDFTSPTKLFHKIILRKLPTIQLTGYVLDGPTKPKIDNANVDVYVNNVLWQHTTTNNQGFYTANVPSGTTFKIASSATGFVPTEIDQLFFTSNREYNITLQKIAVISTYTVNITVIDQSGNPIQNADVCLGQTCTVPAPLKTNSAGKVSFPNLNEAQTYTFYAYHDDYSLQNNFKSIIVDGPESETIQLTSVPRMRVIGTVVNETGGAVVGAAVVLSDGIGDTTGSGIGAGTFDIDRKVTPQPVTIFVTAPGYFTNSERSVPGGTTGTYNVIPSIVLRKIACNTAGSLGDINLTATPFKDTVSLSWTYRCPPTSNQFKVVRKKSSEPSVVISTPTGIPPPTTYDDLNLQEKTTYCYNITATYNFPLVPPPGNIVKKTSAQKCATIGPKACFSNPSREFCDSNTNTRWHCINQGNNTEPLPPACISGEETCVETTPVSAICLSSNKCQFCNRPLGVFSNRATQTPAVFGARYALGSLNYICSIPADQANAIGCFLDVSKTIVDKYNSCDLGGGRRVTSCYDYASKSACEDKKCTPTEDCEWLNLTSYDQLGIGVCRPTNVSQQDCGEFTSALSRREGDRSYLYNKIFASESGSVAKELCSLYGQACYYRANQKSCLNKNEVSCYDYQDQTSCIGANNINVNVNVQWAKLTPGDDFDSRTRGDNRILRNSNDTLGLGVCRWVNLGTYSKCVKDADNNTGKDLPSTEDCINPDDPALREQCALDILPPETTFVYSNYTSEVNFEYSVVDDRSSPEDINTFALPVLTEDIDALSYPIEPSVSKGQLEFGLIAEGPNEPYSLLFFSEDFAHNLEEVKRINFFIDTEAPTINVTTSIKPNTVNNLIDLYVTLKLDNDIRGYCLDNEDTGLFVDGEKQLPNITSLGQPGSTWAERYVNIPTTNDTIAEYVFDCYDKAGNRALEPRSIPLSLDSNGIIQDPRPTIAVPSKIRIPISIKTLYPGECRFIDNDPDNDQTYKDYSLWHKFAETGNTTVNYDSASNSCDPLCEHIGNVTITNNKKKLKVQCNLTGLFELVKGRNGDDIKITVDDLRPHTQPYIVVNSKKVNITFGPEQYWTNGNPPFFRLECVDPYQDGTYPRESGCEAVYYCSQPLTGPTCTPTKRGTTYQPSITSSSAIRFYSNDSYGNSELPIQSPSIFYDGVPPFLNLSPPLNNSIIKTKEAFVTLRGEIENRGVVNQISPLQSIYYELRYRQAPASTVTVPDFNATLTPNPESAGKSTIDETTIPLRANKVNVLKVKVTDKAGNFFERGPITIVHDSQGPNITAAQISGHPISTYVPELPFSVDYNISISHLLDSYPNLLEFGTDPNEQRIGLQKRVSKVIAEDMFGARYEMHPTNDAKDEWVVSLRTSVWPVTTSQFRTFVTIIATDVLGKTEERVIDLLVLDTVEPWADFWLENSYGSRIGELSPGLNFVVLSASEPIILPIMDFNVTVKKYRTLFFAHDFDAKTWTGVVNITDIITPADVTGKLTDVNGLNSSDFRPVNPATKPVTVRQTSVQEPIPVSYKPKINGIYYVNARDVQYAGLLAQHRYDFNINGKINTSYSASNNLVKGFKTGSNNITIRAEDLTNNNYRIFRQNVFVDTIPPIIIGYPSKTYSSSSGLSVNFTESGSLGIDTATTSLTITNSTGGPVAAVTTTNPNTRILTFPSLPPGTYEGHVAIYDVAGNYALLNPPAFKFRINSSAATITSFSASNSIQVNGVYLTADPNPRVKITFNKAVSPVVNLIQVNTVSLTPVTPVLSEGSNRYNFTIGLGTGQYVLEIKSGNDFWLYPITRDSTSPQFAVIPMPNETNANPLVVNAIVTDGERSLLAEGFLSVDGAVKQTLTNMISSDGVYTFSTAIPSPVEGKHNVSVTLRDKLSQQKTVNATIRIDITPPAFGSRVNATSVQNLSGIFTSKDQNTTLSGAYLDEVSEIYVIGKDGAKYNAIIDTNNKKYSIPNIRLVGTTFTETRNDLTLIIKDRAGNMVQKVITIVKDLKPPDLIELLFLRVFG